MQLAVCAEKENVLGVNLNFSGQWSKQSMPLITEIWKFSRNLLLTSNFTVVREHVVYDLNPYRLDL